MTLYIALQWTILACIIKRQKKIYKTNKRNDIYIEQNNSLLLLSSFSYPPHCFCSLSSRKWHTHTHWTRRLKKCLSFEQWWQWVGEVASFQFENSCGSNQRKSLSLFLFLCFFFSFWIEMNFISSEFWLILPLWWTENVLVSWRNNDIIQCSMKIMNYFVIYLNRRHSRHRLRWLLLIFSAAKSRIPLLEHT